MATEVFSDALFLTEEKFLAIEQGPERIELFDGGLYVTPGPTPAHQYFYDAISRTLKEPADHAGVHVHGGVNVRLGPARIVIPDLVITSKIDFYDPMIDVSAVLLVGEILSTNADTDRLIKMLYYAQARIPWYLLIHPGTGVLRLYELEGEKYAEHSVVQPGEILSLTTPVVADIDPARLFPPR